MTLSLGDLDLFQHLVHAAAKYGIVVVKDVVPHPTTVSRHVEGGSQAVQASVAMVIKPVWILRCTAQLFV